MLLFVDVPVAITKTRKDFGTDPLEKTELQRRVRKEYECALRNLNACGSKWTRIRNYDLDELFPKARAPSLALQA